MKKDKQEKIKSFHEYRLIISKKFPHLNSINTINFKLQTIYEFTNFKYEIIVQSIIENHTIHLDIRGLRAPYVSIPNVGPAVFEIEYENLSGNYNVIISKGGKYLNKFSIQIKQDKIVLKKVPQKPYVDIIIQSNNN